MDSIFVGYLDQLAEQILDPRKRLFIGYLASAFLLAIFLQMIQYKKRFGHSLRKVFRKRNWWSQSAKTDYKMMFINQAIMLFVTPRLLSSLALATIIFEILHKGFDGRHFLLTDTPDWVIILLFTLTLFLLDDLTKYIVHRSMHSFRILWHFHKVHHTAETLSPFTVYRTHPLEGVLFAFRATLVHGLTIAVFFFFFGNRVDLLTILGGNALVFIFNVAGANLRHSHIRFSYGRFIEHVFISPSQHQIHHSVDPLHHNKNFGAILALWDWVAGSLLTADKNLKVRFGISDTNCNCHTLRSVYLEPLLETLSYIRLLNMTLLTKQTYRKKAKRLSLVAVLGSIFTLSSVQTSAQEINIYSHRQPFLINPFIEAYEKITGTKANVVFASKGLAQRLQAEGMRSMADIVLTVDIARLYTYADKNLLATIDSKTLTGNVPSHLRDPENKWFAFSKRARIIAVAKNAKDTELIKTYEDLIAPRWKGRLCIRPGSHVYNRALVASIIAAKGEVAATNWATGLVKNLARRPQGNDRAQIKAISEGVCDVAIINSYYFGKLKTSSKKEHQKWASKVRLIFPNQQGRGTHINISGGGVAKHSKNKKEAVRFLEFLTSETAQNLYSTVNYEYPVNIAVEPSEEIRSWGNFQEDTLPISRIAELAPLAQRVIDRVGW